MTHSSFSFSAMQPSLPAFWQQVQQLACDLGIDINPLQADHLAIRINSDEEAQVAHQAWLTQGNEISNAIINGRPIIVIELTKPLSVGEHQVACLELPYPSDKIYTNQGWEHVEFVVPSQACNIEDFVLEVKAHFPALAKQWHQLGEQGITVKLSSPQAEGEALANPTIAFKREDICIKLHPHSLHDVVMSEYK